MSRVEEETVLVGDEMDRTLETYTMEKSTWVRRTEGREHRAWAFRQGALWNKLFGHSEQEFSQIRAQFPAPVVALS